MDDPSNAQVDLIDDEFERLGRLAGAELRQPPPADGPGSVRGTAHRRRARVAVVAAGVTVAVVLAGLLVANSRIRVEPAPIATVPPSPVPPARTTGTFVGTWWSTDTDGSSQSMEIVGSGGDDYDVVVRDNFATTCSGAASTMTGTGRLETDERLAVAQPELTCDDGTSPSIGSPPQAELANFTFELNSATDDLVDRFGVVWRREGAASSGRAPSSVTVAGSASATSGGWWPQSTRDEVRAAQELADAGDPAYTWQLDAGMAVFDGDPYGAEIFTRFIDAELGWEKFISGASFGAGYAGGEGSYEGVLFIRCAPGGTNPLDPLYADAPAGIRGCQPTIDQLTYETVSFSVSQPERRGPSGIWVVDRWEILQSKSDPGSLFGLLYPDYHAGIQVEQIVPPSDAEVTALLQAFLRARVDGAGAEQYLLREPEESPFEDRQVPLLYATTSGAPFEGFEIERVQGPVWPTGWTEYKVRLFAEGETVVEQYFHVVERDGQLGLVYGYASNDVPTTENGQSVAVPQNIFGGTLTLIAPPLVPRGDGHIEIPLTASGGRVVIGEDPVPMSPVREDCLSVAIGTALPIADDAAALARSIEADPDFGTTGAVPVSIAGIDGLQMDVMFNEQDLCYSLWSPSRLGSGTGPVEVLTGDLGWRMRLYLVDYPEPAWPSDSNWRPQVLTIAVIAPQTDFERALEQAASIVESLEFRPG